MKNTKKALETALRMVDELGCAKDASGRKLIVDAINSINEKHLGRSVNAPKVKIGRFEISQYSLDNKDSIWVENDGEGCELKCKNIEEDFADLYKKWF